MNDIEECYYCKKKDKKVECSGIFHCPNALCKGPGASWFRYKLKSYKDLGYRHTVSEFERIFKGHIYEFIRWFKR